jgi:hypothetical protein
MTVSVESFGYSGFLLSCFSCKKSSIALDKTNCPVVLFAAHFTLNRRATSSETLTLRVMRFSIRLTSITKYYSQVVNLSRGSVIKYQHPEMAPQYIRPPLAVGRPCVTMLSNDLPDHSENPEGQLKKLEDHSKQGSEADRQGKRASLLFFVA